MPKGILIKKKKKILLTFVINAFYISPVHKGLGHASHALSTEKTTCVCHYGIYSV